MTRRNESIRPGNGGFFSRSGGFCDMSRSRFRPPPVSGSAAPNSPDACQGLGRVLESLNPAAYWPSLGASAPPPPPAPPWRMHRECTMHRAGIAVLACTQRPMGVGHMVMGDPSAALVGAPDPNSALPSTLCGMRKHTLPCRRAAMPVGLLPIDLAIGGQPPEHAGRPPRAARAIPMRFRPRRGRM